MWVLGTGNGLKSAEDQNQTWLKVLVVVIKVFEISIVSAEAYATILD
jgi:hypothetical protein